MFCKQGKMLCALQLRVAMQLRSGGRKGEGMATGFDESQSEVDKGARGGKMRDDRAEADWARGRLASRKVKQEEVAC